MREHPIPQDVTGYRFHIVGNMTLKQFAEVALGVILAVIFYNTNLLPLIKWPLIVISVGFGAMLAFVPIEERPLDHWVITFFKRLYKPTKFYWKKDSKVPFSFTYKKTEDQLEAPKVEIDLSPARRNRITEYLESVKTHQKKIEPWEQEEQARVSTVLQAFEDVQVETVSAKPQKIKPNLTPRVRNLSTHGSPAISNLSVPKEQLVFKQPTESEQTVEPVEQITEPASYTETHDYAVVEPVEATVELTPEPVSTPIPEPAPTPAPTPETELDLSQVKSNKSLPFPEAPTDPNKVVGMVLTTEDKLVDRATINIKNQNGDTIRSVRTNLLGQFFITGTLPNGTFIIDINKQGMDFTQQELTLSGQVVAPLEIRASA